MKIKHMRFIFAPLLFLSLWSCMQTPGGQSAPYGGHMMYYGFGGIFMWLIFVALAVFIVYIFVSQSRKSGDSGRSIAETPLDILKKRYAKGEITKEEFESMKNNIDR
jgi:putative membrane protein